MSDTAELDEQIASLSLTGKAALVTGGTRGIGRGIALAMAKAGADVVITGRDEASGASFVKAAEQLGARAAYIRADLYSDDAVAKLVPQAAEVFGKIDILVNNAGIGPEKPALDITYEDLREVLRFNLEVPYLLSQEVARRLIADGRKGSIINISSIMGLVSQPGESHYCAAKHGMHGFTKCFAIELSSKGVRVNAIAPGLILTEMTAHWGPEMATRIKVKYPVARGGLPKDIGGVAVFLASDAADFIHGQVITVDGGRTAGSPM